MKKIIHLCLFLLICSNVAIAQNSANIDSLLQFSAKPSGQAKTTSIHHRLNAYSRWQYGIMSDTAHYYYSGSRGASFPNCISSGHMYYPQFNPEINSDNPDIIKADSFFEKKYIATTGVWTNDIHIVARFDAWNQLTFAEREDSTPSYTSKQKNTGVYSAGKLIQTDRYNAGALNLSTYKYYDATGNNIKDSTYNWIASTPDMLEFRVFDGSNRIVLDSTYSLALAQPFKKTMYYYGVNLDSFAEYTNSGSGLSLFSRVIYTYNAYNNYTTIKSYGGIGTTSPYIHIDSFAYLGSNPNYIFYQRGTIDLTTSAYLGSYSVSTHLDSHGNWDTTYLRVWNSTTSAFETRSKRILNYNSYCLVDTAYLLIYDPATGTYPSANLLKETFYYSYFEDGVADYKPDAAGISVYPNPTNGILNIDWSQAQSNKQVAATLTNMMGQKVFTQTGYWQSAKNELQLGSLNEGTYVLTVCDDTGRVIARERITKQ